MLHKTIYGTQRRHTCPLTLFFVEFCTVATRTPFLQWIYLFDLIDWHLRHENAHRKKKRVKHLHRFTIGKFTQKHMVWIHTQSVCFEKGCLVTVHSVHCHTFCTLPLPQLFYVRMDWELLLFARDVNVALSTNKFTRDL